MNREIAYPQITPPTITEVEDYLRKIRQRYELSAIKKKHEEASRLKVLVIGDTILDKYTFVQIKGRAIKDPILSTDFVSTEIYLGGSLAVARHLAQFVKDVHTVTLLGTDESYEDFIRAGLEKNISLKTFYKQGACTTIKERYINVHRNEKLFKVERMNDDLIPTNVQDKILEYLKTVIDKYDIVVLADFGHGFITPSISEFLQNNARYFCVNVQSNSANMGFNYVTKYHKADFISMDLKELQLAVQDRDSDWVVLLDKLTRRCDFKKILVTLGRKGCLFYNKGKTTYGPVLSSVVKDTIGAGDAVFSLASYLTHLDEDDELIPFHANCAGAVAVQITGNKEPITKESLYDMMGAAYYNKLD